MTAILITGSTGMLGRYTKETLERAGFDVVAPTRAEGDLEHSDQIIKIIMETAPAAILHLGALTDVDLCERDPARAYAINARATEQIAQAAAKVGAWILYISTSNVFGAASKTIYNELDLPNPVNYYGLSKLAGEKAILNCNPNNNCIIRAGWMIGGGPENDKKFVGRIASQIVSGETRLVAVDDKYGTITSAPRLAEFIRYCITSRLCGIFHYSSIGCTNRYEIACAVTRAFSFAGNVTGVRSSVFPLSAPRPTFEAIESIKSNFYPPELHARRWVDDLYDYLKTFPASQIDPAAGGNSKSIL